MPHNTTETAWRAEVFYGTLLLFLLVVGGVGFMAWRRSEQTRQHVPAVSTAGELGVVRRLEVDGAPYLLWSNGQITPDMAAHRKYILRTVAAQALLESQAAESPPGR